MFPFAVYGVHELYDQLAPVDDNVKLASHVVDVGLHDRFVYHVFHQSTPFVHVTIHVVHIIGHVVDDVEYTVTAIGPSVFTTNTDKGNIKTIDIQADIESIGANAFKDCDNITIYGYKDTYAETFASDNGISFVALEENSCACCRIR